MNSVFQKKIGGFWVDCRAENQPDGTVLRKVFLKDGREMLVPNASNYRIVSGAVIHIPDDVYYGVKLLTGKGYNAEWEIGAVIISGPAPVLVREIQYQADNEIIATRFYQAGGVVKITFES